MSLNTTNPKAKKGIKKFGFRARVKQGGHVIAARRLKGRKHLSNSSK